MRSWRRLRATVFPLLILALIAAATVADAPRGVASPQPPPDAATDELFAAVAQRVPAFGGAYVDEKAGELRIWTTRPERSVAESAQRAMAKLWDDQDLAALRPVVLRADYDFLTLSRWYRRMTGPVFGVDGVVFTDIDEGRNRLAIGVEDPAQQRPMVEPKLREQGIPLEAVVIEQAEPADPEPPAPIDEDERGLHGLHRPVVGGLQISFFDGGRGFVCTLGFNAGRSGVRGFVTNSHCTDVEGRATGMEFFQNRSPFRIGVETVDPGFFTGGACPAGKRCRRSDSAFARYDDLIPATRGDIARAPFGSHLWNGIDLFRITSRGAPIQGQAVVKVGRTTGRSTGTVTNTCRHFSFGGDRLLLCQAVAKYVSKGGDSGAPVFRVTHSPQRDDVSLRGIHWGKFTNNKGKVRRVFSRIAGVRRDLDLGRVCTGSFSC